MEKPQQEYQLDFRQRIKLGIGKLIMAISYGGAPYMGWAQRYNTPPLRDQQELALCYEAELNEDDDFEVYDWAPHIVHEEVKIMNLGLLAINKRLSILDRRDIRTINQDVFNLEIMDGLTRDRLMDYTWRDKRHLKLLWREDFLPEDLDIQLECHDLGYIE